MHFVLAKFVFMKLIRKTLLDAIGDYQNLIHDGWHTVASTLDRIVGLDSCPISVKFRDGKLQSHDSEWINWRAYIYVECRFWQGHLAGTEQVVEAARMFPNVSHYLEAARLAHGINGFDASQVFQSFASNSRWTYVNCLLPEPTYEHWTNELSKNPKTLATSFCSDMGPELLFGKPGKAGRLGSASDTLSSMLLGVADAPRLSRRLRQHGGDGTLDRRLHELRALTNLQFAEAKRLAITNPPADSVWYCLHDNTVSELIPRLRDNCDRAFNEASLSRLKVMVDPTNAEGRDPGASVLQDCDSIARQSLEVAEGIEPPDIAQRLKEFSKVVCSETTEMTWGIWRQLRDDLREYSQVRRTLFSLEEWSHTVPDVADVGSGDLQSKTTVQPKSQAKKKGDSPRSDSKEELFKSYLVQHHKYEAGAIENWEPIGSNQLANAIEVSVSTASSYFKKWFGGHQAYKQSCFDQAKLRIAMKQFTNESLLTTYGSDPENRTVED